MHTGERRWFYNVKIARNGSETKGVERRDMAASWILRTDRGWVDSCEGKRGEMPDRFGLVRAARG